MSEPVQASSVGRPCPLRRASLAAGRGQRAWLTLRGLHAELRCPSDAAGRCPRFRGPRRWIVGHPVLPAALAALDPAELARLRRLEAHLRQIDGTPDFDGTPGDPDPTADPRYDIRSTTVEERVASKVAELAGGDLAFRRTQLFRLLAAYRAEGAVGLLPAHRRRAVQGGDGLAGVDERVVAGLREVMSAQTSGRRSPGKCCSVGSGHCWRRHPATRCRCPAIGCSTGSPPSWTGAATCSGRQRPGGTTANRPDRPFTAGVEMRPGQQVHIDTNTVDIMCRYADGVTRRAELTIAVDVATRSIGAGVVAPSTKAVDAVAVLARMVVPDPLRPGWPESLLFAHSSLPFERLLSIDARFERAAARPVILPDTHRVRPRLGLHGGDFRRACRALGISVHPPALTHRPTRPSWNALSVPSTLCSASMWTGMSAATCAMRVRIPPSDAVFTVAQLQDLFDEWVVAVWQNRPHESLTHLWGQDVGVPERRRTRR